MLIQMVDVVEREHYPSSRDADSDVVAAGPAAGGGASHQQSDGFSVRGAPWSNAAPDTNSRDDFPDLAQVFIASSNQSINQSINRNLYKKGVCMLFMEIHLTTTECHLLY